MCGRYVTPDEAAMERAYSLTAIPCGTCVREQSGERPPKSRPSRHPGRAPRAMGAANCEDSNRYRVFVNAEGRVIVQQLD